MQCKLRINFEYGSPKKSKTVEIQRHEIRTNPYHKSMHAIPLLCMRLYTKYTRPHALNIESVCARLIELCVYIVNSTCSSQNYTVHFTLTK